MGESLRNGSTGAIGQKKKNRKKLSFLRREGMILMEKEKRKKEASEYRTKEEKGGTQWERKNKVNRKRPCILHG